MNGERRRENRAAPRRVISGLELSWRVPAAATRRCRRTSTAVGLDVSRSGIAVAAPVSPQFSPGARVVVWCGVHEFRGIVRRCEPLNDAVARYGIEFEAVAEATVEKLFFYAAARDSGWRLGPAD